MKLNINKELLIKHRFWIMLGAAVLLGTGPLVLLVTTVKAAIDQNRQTLDKANDRGNAESAKSDVKTPKDIEAVNNEEKKLAGTRGGIHEKGYQSQKYIYVFPEELESKFEFTNGLFAEMIRINKEKEAVGDNELDKNIVHGVITETATTFILVKDKKGKIWKFFDSPALAPDKNKIFHVGQIVPLSEFSKLEERQSVSVFFQKGKFFGDPLTKSERLEFRNVYKNQIDPILALVDPIDENGKGRVRLGDTAFFDLPKNKKAADDDNPWPFDEFSEDFWIFQENLWIYKEIFSLIKDANDSVAKFKVEKVYPKVKEKGKLPTAYVCTNPYWEIKLVITGEDTADATFKNVLSRGQKLDFELKLKVAGAAEPVFLKFLKMPPVFNPLGFSKIRGTPSVDEGEDVQTVPLKIVAADGKSSVDLRQAEIQEVWQELNWETAPVRRIDGIYVSAMNSSGISAESHRSFPKALKAYVPPTSGSATPAAAAPADPKAAPAPGGKDKGPGPAPGGKDKGPGGKDGGAKKSVYGSDETTTKLGQIRERYTEVSNQLRRLPVAVCLTVEQSQVDRVQTAFINSKLRFLPEQVSLTHSAGSLNPAAAKREGGGPKERPNPGGNKGKNPGKDFNPGRETRPNQPNANAGAGSAGDELEANVEIVIYGVITIYERFPYRAVRPNWN